MSPASPRERVEAGQAAKGSAGMLASVEAVRAVGRDLWSPGVGTQAQLRRCSFPGVSKT